jgi:hypothetical protein
MKGANEMNSGNEICCGIEGAPPRACAHSPTGLLKDRPGGGRQRLDGERVVRFDGEDRSSRLDEAVRRAEERIANQWRPGYQHRTDSSVADPVDDAVKRAQDRIENQWKGRP